MTPENVLIFLIGISLFHFLLERGLSWLNLKRYTPQMPKEAEGIYSAQEYARSMAYHWERQQLSLISGSFSIVVSILFLVFGWFGVMDSWVSARLEEPFLQAIAFFAILMIASDLMALPFQWKGIFGIEEKYGFNKTTPRLFFTDKLKGYALTALFGGGLLYLFFWVTEAFGQDFWWIFWLIVLIISLLSNIFYTSWIMPLFNKLSPLADGELKEAVSEYARKVRFPLAKIMVIDGSKRSTRANAFFSGMGRKKKIVLYDTLIDQHPTEELVAVLAHEVGHYKKRHIWIHVAFSALSTGLMLLLMSRLLFWDTLSLALGAQDYGMHLNLLAFVLLYSPVSFILSTIGNVLSRKHEYEADAYAATTLEGGARKLSSALKGLSVKNLSHLTPHPAYVFFKYSHPPLLSRLGALKQLE
jgi:STE24 endopeptidase